MQTNTEKTNIIPNRIFSFYMTHRIQKNGL